jgi:hypothetical protein
VDDKTRNMRIIKYLLTFLLLLTVLSLSPGQSLPKNYGTIQPKLFLGDNKARILAVAFGGSEGGNTFATEQTKELRDKFLGLGFAFLSIGYFGDKGLPKKLDRISLNSIYDTIKSVSKRIKIDSNKILLVGASRGAELVLNLGSRYSVLGVIALVPSSVSLPHIDNKESKSSWTFDDKEVPYLRLPYDVIKKDGWLKTIETALKKEDGNGESFIKVEKIKGFVFLTSGKIDEFWPSRQMCDHIVDRLKKNDFKNHYEHVSFDGGHQPSKHWEVVFKFIDEHVFDH